jgi:hypothetical protein
MTDDHPLTNGAWRDRDGRWIDPLQRRRYGEGSNRRLESALAHFTRQIQISLRYTKRTSINDRLLGLRAARSNVERFEHVVVQIARRAGWSWEQIGLALGLSASGARRRYGRGEPLGPWGTT